MSRTGIETIICLSPNFLYVYVYVFTIPRTFLRFADRSFTIFHCGRSKGMESSALPQEYGVGIYSVHKFILSSHLFTTHLLSRCAHYCIDISRFDPYYACWFESHFLKL